MIRLIVESHLQSQSRESTTSLATLIVLFILFTLTPLSSAADTKKQSGPVIGEPSKPIAVEIDPKTLRELSRKIQPGTAPPEGTVPKGPIPPRRPIQDPTVQGTAVGVYPANIRFSVLH